MLTTDQQPPANFRKSLDQRGFEAAVASHERYLRSLGGARAMLQFVDAPGLNLPRRMMNDVDFTGADVSRSMFAGCHFERASLYCTDLSGCDLRASNLKRADLRGACLIGASLNGAVLDEADMRAAYVAVPDGKGGLQMRWRPGPASRTSDTADFTNCTLRGARLRNANLKGANFTGAILEGADLSGAKLTDALFHEAVLTNVNIADLALTADQLSGCVLDPGPQALAKMPQIAAMLRAAADWVESGGKLGSPAVLDGEDLRPLGAAFQSRLLTGLTARGVCAIRVDFSGSELQGAVFDDADLRGAIFEGADLRGASFRNAKLSHASMRRANLAPLTLGDGKQHFPDFAGCNLERADFTGTPLDGAQPSADKPVKVLAC
jgi:uncharacterized protein YjbI with pentapeptide repeats